MIWTVYARRTAKNAERIGPHSKENEFGRTHPTSSASSEYSLSSISSSDDSVADDSDSGSPPPPPPPAPAPLGPGLCALAWPAPAGGFAPGRAVTAPSAAARAFF